MEFNFSLMAVIVALLVSISATYNAYILRGGKLAWSQVLMVLGTVSLMFSLVLSIVEVSFVNVSIFGGSITDLLHILGFVLLFGSSLRLRYSLK